MSKRFSPITTSSHDIVMQVVMGRKDFTYNWKHLHAYIVTTSCNGGERLCHIFDSVFMTISWPLVAAPLQLVVTIKSCKCSQLYVKSFLPITTGSHDIVNWDHLHDYIVTTSCRGREKISHITDSIFMTISWLPVVMGRKDFTYNWQHLHAYIVW
jgi:uncharacterized membrane protein